MDFNILLDGVKLTRNTSVTQKSGDGSMVWGPKAYTLEVDFTGVMVKDALEATMKQLVVDESNKNVRKMTEADADKFIGDGTVKRTFATVGMSKRETKIAKEDVLAKTASGDIDPNDLIKALQQQIKDRNDA